MFYFPPTIWYDNQSPETIIQVSAFTLTAGLVPTKVSGVQESGDLNMQTGHDWTHRRILENISLALSRRQSIDPWPTIICNIPTGIIPTSFEYDLILFPFVSVFQYYQSVINVFFTEIKATITWSKKSQLVFCDLDPN